MKCFCDNYGLKALIRKPTCYKNSENSTGIDLMLTNVPRSFQSTCVIETGLSDFHLMTLTVMRKEYRKFQSRIISYRSYRHFLNEKFRENLLYNLSKVNLVNNVDGFQKCDIGFETTNKHAPCEQKYVRSNQMPFFTKEFSKAVMTRSRLQNSNLKN